ncbi:MAG: PilZ domain-containing protein [Deltaproteobacteria bacterium]|nr:PilZ domain-containing protein [Deltaproteobacteria bacterium]
MPDQIENRKHTRIEVRWPITVLTKDGTEIKGETRNITVEGMFIICKEPLPLNEICRISIRPPNHRNIEITCKVIWSNLYGIDDDKSAYGMGFCFVQVSDKDRHFLSDAISAHHES